MTGRDPNQHHRAATPLELLFDLAFVVAFGQAADQLAHFIAEDHVGAGLLGFAFAMGATCWAWINFSWFASAYDTDDWIFRVTTMVQMIGVVILALGIPTMFHSLEEGADHLDNTVIVAGYVVMRVGLIAHWLRAAKHDPARRRTALTYAMWVGIAQVGWVALSVLDTSTEVFVVCALALFAAEFTVPIFAERKSSGTPWHPHHIAERYGLLTIIALGEGVIGTVAAVSVLVEEQDWSGEAVLVAVAGVGLTFGLWWIYFVMPSGDVLARFRNRSFPWGYGHILLFGSIAAMGAGLHVVAYVVEGHAVVGTTGAIAAVAIPVLVFTLGLYALYSWLMREFDPFHVGLLGATVALLVFAMILAGAGVSLGVCLVVVTLAPAVSVVGFELLGHRHRQEALARVLAQD